MASAESYSRNFVVTGVEELDKELTELPIKLQKKVIRQAQRNGAKLLLGHVKARAPKKTGALKKALKIKAAPRSKKFVGVDIGVGKEWFTGDQFAASFLEFGWKPGGTGEPVTEHAFIKPTYEQYGQQTKTKVLNEMFVGLMKLADVKKGG